MTRRLDGCWDTPRALFLTLVAFAAALPIALGASPARGEFREVSIVDDEFEPPEVIIRRGDTIVWVHRGVRPHGVRAADGSFDSNPGCSFQNGGSCMRSGDRYSRTFDQAGTFSYYCPVHGSANGIGMAGQITVASGDGGPASSTTTAPPQTTQTTRQNTTAPPQTTAAPTTQSPGAPTTAQGTTTAQSEPSSDTTVIVPPSEESGDTTTSSILVALPVNGEPGDGDGVSILIGVAAAVVLAAAISATAWYYRPGARGPGGPPPAAPPA